MSSTIDEILQPVPQLLGALDQTPLMIWVADSSGAMLFVNRVWTVFRAREARSELGHGWLEGVPADERAAVRDRHIASCREPRPFRQDYRLRRADGALRWVAMTGQPWCDRSGRHVAHIGTCVDMTARREQDEAELSERVRLEALLESADGMAFRIRLYPTRAIEYLSGALEGITGHTAQEFYADPDLPRKALHPDDAGKLVDSLDTAHDSSATLRWLHADGTTVWAEHRRRRVYDETGRVVAVEGIARDVTGLVESQQRLRDSEEQMRHLAARLQSAREEERARVARELHDELGQTLTALKLEISRAIAALSVERLTPSVVDRLQSLMGLSELGLTTVKRIATDLRPPTLDHLGLVEAIRWEAIAFKARSGIRCHLRMPPTYAPLNPEQETAIFRIFQESLTNVTRHAHASAVTVTLSERKGFNLRIRDNGRGITAVQAADPRAIGLIGMRERAALVGAVFHIEGRRGRGTTVSVHVPQQSPPPASGRARPGKVRAAH